MYAQPAQGGEQWQGQPSYTGGAFPPNANPSYPSQSNSSSSLLQQQLAQQAAMQQQQQQQQQGQPQQSNPYQQQQRNPSSQLQDGSYQQDPSAPSPQQNGQQPPLSQPPPPSQQYQQQQQGQQNPFAGLTPEKFAALPPNQQQAIRDYMLRQRAAQQGAVGMGHPGSPAASGGGGGGSPAPVNGNAGGAYGYPRQGAGLAQGQAPQQQQQQAPQHSSPSIAFARTLVEFFTKKGIQFPGPPVVEGRQLDLARFYALVVQGGGFQQVYQQGTLPNVITQLGFQPDVSGAHPDSRLKAITHAYQTTLWPFEQAFLQRNQQMRLASGGAPPLNSSTPVQNPPLPQAPQNLIPRTASQGGFYGQVQQPSSLQNAAPSPSNSSFQQSPRQLPQGLPMQGLPLGMGTQRVPTPQQQQATYQQAATPPAVLDDRKMKGKGKEVEKKRKVQPAKKGKSVQDDAESYGAPSPAPSPAPSNSYAGTPAPSSFSTDPSAASTSTLAQPFNSALDPSTNAAPSLSGRPGPSLSTDDVKRATPELPTGPPRRKRQKIEYVPLSRSVDTYAGWDLAQVEELMHNVASRKPTRIAAELGNVDIHSLTMSLKSRLGTEVAFALNVLTLLSLAMRIFPNDQTNLHFPLSSCGFLLDELVDLLEETAFGIEGEFSDAELDEASWTRSKGGKDESILAPLTYRDLFRLVTEEEAELLGDPVSALKTANDLSNDGLCPLGPVETVSAITNLLRNLSLWEENARTMVSRPDLLEVLVRVANLPLRRNGPTKGRWPVQVSAAESMALRKDVLVTLSNFGLEVRLSRHSPETVASLFDLLTFFLADSDHQDQLYFDLSSSPSSAARLAQPPHQNLSHYVDLGLATFARITLTDSNRSVLAKALATRDLFPLFESLIHLLPITEADFQVVTSEPGLIYTENLAMSIYNLAFFAPVELKLRLRVVPAFIKGLLRVVRRLTSVSADPAENPFGTLCDRCIATLQILSDVGGTTGKSQEDADAPWFGLGMNGDFEDKPRGCNPTEADRATVKARQPPANGANPGGPPVLLADSRSMFEGLFGPSGAPMFVKLMGAGLVDPKRGSKE